MPEEQKRRNNIFRNRFFLPAEDLANQRASIKVVGVGGGGSNAVDRMIGENIEGVDFYVANTDAQALGRTKVKNRIQFGNDITKGLGAGANPKIGQQAAIDDKDKFTDELSDSDMIFITAGMGGGTGTGAVPEIAKALKEKNQQILIVGVVTTPFNFEGISRRNCAEQGVRNLKTEVDSLITIPNEKIFNEGEMTLKNAYKKVDDVLFNAVQGISDLIIRTGYINVDFADVKTVMSESGCAMMGTGQATGDDRARIATERAIDNPLLEDVDVHNSTGLLVNVTANSDMSVYEFQQVNDIVSQIASDDAVVIAGQIFDDEIGDEIRVTIVATGLRDGNDELFDDFGDPEHEDMMQVNPVDDVREILPVHAEYSDPDRSLTEDVIPAVFRNNRGSNHRQYSTEHGE